MIGAGVNMRTGPICRNVQDAAKILNVIAGYDPKDENTVFSVGRTPAQPYPSFASAQRLEGVRIGVIREYMSKKLFSKADEESIDIVEHAIGDLRKLGATIVDPGPEGALFQVCISRYAPELLNSAFTRQYREVFPVDPAGQPQSDHAATLLEMHADPARVPQSLSLRTLVASGIEGEGKYMMNRYLRERADANIKTSADLIAQARVYDD